MAENLEDFFANVDLDNQAENIGLATAAKHIHAFLTNNASATETAHKIIIADNAPMDEIVEEVIISAAEQLFETHTKIAKLVVELSKGQGAADNTLYMSIVYSLGQRWSRYGDPDWSDVWRDRLRLEWANLNRFVALLYSDAELKSWSKLADFGKATLGYALRRGGWRVRWKGPENTSDNPVALEGHASAAAYWIIFSGKRLYDEEEDIRDKWSTWISDLEWILQQNNPSKDIDDLGREALVEMRRIQI